MLLHWMEPSLVLGLAKIPGKRDQEWEASASFPQSQKGGGAAGDSAGKAAAVLSRCMS